MSAKLMGMVFELDLTGPPQTIMLCLADHAHDDGTHVFPSIAYLAWKSGCSERTVQRTLRELEDLELIKRTVYGVGRGNRNEWSIHIANGVRKSPFIPSKGDSVTPFTRTKGDRQRTLKGDIAVSPEPSVREPSVENELLPTVVVHSAPKKNSAVDPIWEEHVAVWGFSPTPKTPEHKRWNVACAIYRGMGYQPGMVQKARDLYNDHPTYGKCDDNVMAVANRAENLLRGSPRKPEPLRSTAMRALKNMPEQELQDALNSRVQNRNGNAHIVPATARELGSGGGSQGQDVRTTRG